jgi:hypothetical protein
MNFPPSAVSSAWRSPISGCGLLGLAPCDRVRGAAHALRSDDQRKGTRTCKGSERTRKRKRVSPWGSTIPSWKGVLLVRQVIRPGDLFISLLAVSWCSGFLLTCTVIATVRLVLRIYNRRTLMSIHHAGKAGGPIVINSTGNPANPNPPTTPANPPHPGPPHPPGPPDHPRPPRPREVG